MSLPDVPADADTYELWRAITSREEVLKQLVGNLYPQVVKREIEELKERLPTAKPGTVLHGILRFRRPITTLSFNIPREAVPGFQDEIPQKCDAEVRRCMKIRDLFYIQTGSRKYLAEFAFVVPLGPIYEIIKIL